ncbi:hypothetical protein B0H14DRAFT_2380144, partial [Mycena olivaceomarginata]
WNKCRSIISESLDECFVGSWVFAQSATGPTATISGRISDILTNHTGTVIMVLEMFQVLSARDPLYGMPVLVRRDGETTFTILPGKNIKFKINVQHDCYTANCESTGERPCIQERVESDTMESFSVHKPLDRFIINSHAFHNAHLLRATLPRDLLAPIPLFEDRRAKHAEFAATLREKRADKVAKRKAMPPATGKKKTASKKKKRKAGDAAESSKPKKRARAATDQTAPREPGESEGVVAQAETVQMVVLREPDDEDMDAQADQAAPREPGDDEGLVAGRAKRTITRTKRAMAAEDDGDEEDGSSESSSDSDMYADSEDDFSD